MTKPGQDQDSLLVKRRNDNQSPGQAGTAELMKCASKIYF